MIKCQMHVSILDFEKATLSKSADLRNDTAVARETDTL